MIKTILHNDPYIYCVNNFIDNNTANHIINIAKPLMEKALVSSNKQGIISNGRTNTNCWIKHNHDEIFLSLGKKIAKIVKIPLENAEAFQIIHYEKDQEYKQHYDAWDFDNSEKSIRNMKFGGNRICTALCYLNNIEEGGGTKFTLLDKQVNAEKSKLLIFYNVYEGTNKKHHLSEHAGMPVIKGEKWAFNLWFREQTRNKEYVYPILEGENNIKSNNIVENICYRDINCDIKLYENVFQTSELNELISKCSFTNKNKSVVWINNNNNVNFINIIKKIINVDNEYLENLCITKHKPGLTHGYHLDAYDLSCDIGIKNTKHSGQRLITITGFITKTTINFSKYNKSIICNPGSVIIYNNCLNNSSIRNTQLSKSFEPFDKNNDMINFSFYIREKGGNNSKILKYNNFKLEICNIPTIKPILNYKTIIDNIYNKPLIENLNNKEFNIVNKASQYYVINTLYQIKNIRINSNNEFLNPINLQKDYFIDEYNPVVIEDVIISEIHKIINEYFKTNIKNGVYPFGDRQSKRYKLIDEIITRLLHLEFLPLIEKIVGQKMEPTYTYISAYTKGSDLPAHTDRPECEFTCSYILGKPPNSNWNIYIHKVKQPVKYKGRYAKFENGDPGYTPPKEECIVVDCQENGLMIFNGTDHIHYREPLEDEYYNVVLLHYKKHNIL